VTFPEATDDHRAIIAASTNALRDLYKRGFGYKKAGVVLTKLIPKSGIVGSLFAERENVEREERLSAAIDAIRHTHGRAMLRLGAQGSGTIISAHKMQSPHYTTLWSDLPKVTVK
jgi:DNA polymerase V